MYVRLGFAVAVHVDPAILLVDEVLAVGDDAFQRKCLDKVGRSSARAGPSCSSPMPPDLVMRMCDRAVLLEHGRVAAEGVRRRWSATSGC